MTEAKLRVILEDYAAITGISGDTKRLHLICLTHFERFLNREPLIADLNDLTYAKFVAWRSPKVSQETLRGDCCKLLALWRWCSGGKRRWIDPPEVKAPQPAYRLPKALDREQLERLWKVATTYPQRVGTLPGHIVLTAWLYVLWDTSERIGAVHHIRRDDIDLARGWIMVNPEVRKNGREGRLYKVRPAAVQALKRLLEIYEGEMPFAECSLSNWYKHWAVVRNKAGLPRWATPHTIRKSHASHLVASGGDARASLGHSSDVVTNRHYLDARITGEGKSPCDLLFDPGESCIEPPWWRRLLG